MFTKVLIANRGEIALRINQTLEAMGIEGVGIYTRADRRSLHVKSLRSAILLEDFQRTGYLDSEQIVRAALKSGCQAIHPGYGFLAESAEFAQRCRDAGLTFIGPNSEVIASMGEKIAARALAESAGVPVVPGISRPGMSDEEIIESCRNLDFPLLVKPSAGGGGKGLHIVKSISELQQVLPTARREAANAFGDDTLFVERYVANARHIEFQILADVHGGAIHLGERECSLQRRHQKVIEEAPSPLLTDSIREAMGNSALALVKKIGYQNAGTIEFLVDADDPNSYYFMEMNTRLQVEHRVTELISGIDLVEAQLRIASGERLETVIPSVEFRGHAIEARIYAEDPYAGFLPTAGRVSHYGMSEVTGSVVDSAIEAGQVITSSFDPMLAKVAAWGENREQSTSHLIGSLQRFEVLGLVTNTDFLIDLLKRREFKDGSFTTHFIEAMEISKPNPPDEVLQAFAEIATRKDHAGSWRFDGWRARGATPVSVVGYVNGKRYEISEGFSAAGFHWAADSESVWLHHPQHGTWQVRWRDFVGRAGAESDSSVVSPMPGVVISLDVAAGDAVEVGQSLMTVEAMKMEHVVRAKKSGVVKTCYVQAGSSVRAGQVLLEVG